MFLFNPKTYLAKILTLGKKKVNFRFVEFEVIQKGVNYIVQNIN